LKEMKRRNEEEMERLRQEEIAKSSPAPSTERVAAAAAAGAQDQPEGAAGERPADTSSIRSGNRVEGEEMEGMLVRKHQWESTTKKASNRSWDKVCVVLKANQIGFYKDQRSYRSTPDATYRGEPPIDLSGGAAEIATDYTKKKNVFRLRLSNGGDYLFQANDQDEMVAWVNNINQAVQQTAEAAGAAAGGRSQTLPAGIDKRDEPKKRSFFTLKKK